MTSTSTWVAERFLGKCDDLIHEWISVNPTAVTSGHTTSSVRDQGIVEDEHDTQDCNQIPKVCLSVVSVYVMISIPTFNVYVCVRCCRTATRFQKSVGRSIRHYCI